MVRIINKDDDSFVPSTVPPVKAPLDTAFDLDDEYWEDLKRHMDEEE